MYYKRAWKKTVKYIATGIVTVSEKKRHSLRPSPATGCTSNFNNDNQNWSQQLQNSHNDHRFSDWLIPNRWKHINRTRYIHQVMNKKKYMEMHTTTVPLLFTATKTSSLRLNSYHRLHWKISLWQPPVQPVKKISTRRRHCRSGAWAIWKHSHIDHSMSMVAIVVVFATTWDAVSDHSVATAPMSPNQRFSLSVIF